MMSEKQISAGETSAPGTLSLLARLLIFVAILAAILFLAAGRWDWTTGWLYMGMYALVTSVGVFAVPLDPELVEERTQIKEGVKEWDKRLTTIGSLFYPLAILVVAGLDARWNWSPSFPAWIPWAALIVAAAGNLLSIWATAANKFYGRFVRIQKERGHYVVSDGPYRFIRHPGYLGQIIFSLASALALTSLWTLIPSGLFAAVLVVRTALEDRVLHDELDGYSSYTQRVRYRLLPPIW
jgi:protein-S-isoprenylcysteine O-methyltransferase Ste14